VDEVRRGGVYRTRGISCPGVRCAVWLAWVEGGMWHIDVPEECGQARVRPAASQVAIGNEASMRYRCGWMMN
jgi:hypothetical protein